MFYHKTNYLSPFNKHSIVSQEEYHVSPKIRLSLILNFASDVLDLTSFQLSRIFRKHGNKGYFFKAKKMAGFNRLVKFQIAIWATDDMALFGSFFTLMGWGGG